MQTTPTHLYPPPTNALSSGIIQPSAFWWFCPGLMGFHFTQISHQPKILQDCPADIQSILSHSLPKPLLALFCTVNSSQFPLILVSAPQSHWRPLSTLSILPSSSLAPAGSGCRQQAGTAIELTLCVFHSPMLPAIHCLVKQCPLYFV